MYRVVNEYISKINLLSNNEIYSRLMTFQQLTSNIKSYTISCNFNRYIVDVKLDDFCVDNAEDFFNDFNRIISYPYSSLHVRFNEGSCVRYRYVTCKENKDGFYCDIIVR